MSSKINKQHIYVEFELLSYQKKSIYQGLAVSILLNRTAWKANTTKITSKEEVLMYREVLHFPNITALSSSSMLKVPIGRQLHHKLQNYYCRKKWTKMQVTEYISSCYFVSYMLLINNFKNAFVCVCMIFSIVFSLIFIILV